MKKIVFSLALLGSAFHAFAQNRIVSTAGFASEMIYLLGQADKLVGVDVTALNPPEVMSKIPKIGYRRNLSAEGILGLNPDLIILVPDASPELAVQQIKNAPNVKILALKDEKTLAGIREEITQIGEALSVQAEAEKLNARLLEDEAQLKALQSQTGTGNALILLHTGAQGVFGLGVESAGDHLLKILGLNNLFAEKGNKPFANEALASTTADVVLIAIREEDKNTPTIAPLKAGQFPVLEQTDVYKKGCAFQVNISHALGFGAHTAQYAKLILEALQPCLKK